MKRAVAAPGSKGGQYHLSREGNVEYGKQGQSFQRFQAALRPSERAQPRAERRRQWKAGPEHFHAFRAAYQAVRAQALGLIAAAKSFAHDAKLKLLHGAMKVAETWEHLEHKLGAENAEHLVLHALIEVPEILELLHQGAELLKAEQGDLFGRARPMPSRDPAVQAPGSRGGHGYYDTHGNWQYGAPPSAHARAIHERHMKRLDSIRRFSGGRLSLEQAEALARKNGPTTLPSPEIDEDEAVLQRSGGRPMTKSYLSDMLKAREVKAPGAKGGKYHRTKRGAVRYGDEPIGTTRSGKPIPHAQHAAYQERHKLPKWNSQPGVGQEAGAMRRSEHFREWTKDDHLDAAEAHAKQRKVHRAEHGKLYQEAEAAHGRQGPEISGVGQEHWPEDTKEQLRTHAHAASASGDASATHYKMAGKRTPYWRSGLGDE